MYHFLQLWVAGGEQDGSCGQPFVKTDLIDENGSVPGPDLPFSMYRFCGTRLNKTHGILTGNAKSDNKRTLIVDLNNVESMSEGPEYSNKWHDNGCGSFKHENGTDFVVMAGGYHKDHWSTQHVEILNANEISNGWYQGKSYFCYFQKKCKFVCFHMCFRS